MRTATSVWACLLGAALVTNSAAAAEFKLTEVEGGIAVTIDGKPFTTYLTKSVAKPILWPVVGPAGDEMTRGYPMRPATPDERADHIHHRSFWFTHGDVNGIDFWAETPNHGNIVHREFVSVAGGQTGHIVTLNDWIGPDGKKVCEDQRKLTFGTDGQTRWVDFDVTVKASEGKLTFGDTKEGAFGVRVAGTLDVDAKKGGKIVNSEGQRDGAAWGKPAKWVDYYGPLPHGVGGIAILNHPTSFRHPTHWHVRTYGLFTANPFGLRSFTGSRDVDGSHTMEKGESFTLRHRVLFHQGDAEQAKIAEHFAKYAAQP